MIGSECFNVVIVKLLLEASEMQHDLHRECRQAVRPLPCGGDEGVGVEQEGTPRRSNLGAVKHLQVPLRTSGSPETQSFHA